MMKSHEQQIEDFGKNDDFWLFGYGSLIWKPPPHYDQRVPGYIEGYVRRFWQASEDHRGTPEAPGRVVTLIDRPHIKTLMGEGTPIPNERVWGAAYHIPAAKVAEVRTYLDIREINGYSIQFTAFHPAAFYTSITSRVGEPASPTQESSSAHASPRSIMASTTILAQVDKHLPPIQCLVYIGLPENPQFLGPQDPDQLARHILKSRGPSGENREYLFFLEKALLELSRDSGDEHVSDLVRRCREIEREEAGEEEEGDGADTAAGSGEDVVGSSMGAPLHKIGSTEEQEEVEK